MEFKDVEKARDDYREKLTKRIGICVSIALVIMLLFAAFGSGGAADSFLIALLSSLLQFGIFVVFICLIIIVVTAQKEGKKYKAAYKAYFVRANLEKFFSDLKYDHNLGFNRNTLVESQMINTGDRYYSNDFTSGKYKDVFFAQADVHIQVESTDSDGNNTTYTTIFKGRMMLFEFPKKFAFKLEVVEKRFGANRIPPKNEKTGRKYHIVKLESSEFNKVFKTYAEDDFEAFYLLDPALMNNIMALENEYKGKILLGFFDNKLLVALNDGKDAFEPPNVFKKLDEKTEMEKIAKETHIITDFVDTLKLNNKIFK